MDLSELNRDQSQNINRHPWELTRLRIIAFFLKKQKNPFDHILDIGSGDVFVLNELSEIKVAKKYSAIDIEYNNEVITDLKSQNPNSDISFYSSLNELTTNNSDIDCLLFLDVLEHCDDDQSVLSESLKQIDQRKDATILITVPAYQSLYSEHDKILNHYRRYNRQGILKLCSANNLIIKESGYFFFSLTIFRFINILVEKLGFKKNKTIDNWKGSSFFTKLLSSFLWIDFKIGYFISSLGIRLPGLSCYCLCQKLPS